MGRIILEPARKKRASMNREPGKTSRALKVLTPRRQSRPTHATSGARSAASTKFYYKSRATNPLVLHPAPRLAPTSDHRRGGGSLGVLDEGVEVGGAGLVAEVESALLVRLAVGRAEISKRWTLHTPKARWYRTHQTRQLRLARADVGCGGGGCLAPLLARGGTEALHPAPGPAPKKRSGRTSRGPDLAHPREPGESTHPLSAYLINGKRKLLCVACYVRHQRA